MSQGNPALLRAVDTVLVQLVCTGMGKSAPISEAQVLCRKEIICYSPV